MNASLGNNLSQLTNAQSTKHFSIQSCLDVHPILLKSKQFVLYGDGMRLVTDLVNSDTYSLPPVNYHPFLRFVVISGIGALISACMQFFFSKQQKFSFRPFCSPQLQIIINKK